jgi:SulP family sulfate permease
MSRLTQIFPLLDWLPTYDRSQLRGDLAAGLTVGVMLIPQGMAYAMIAGIPPIYGLYASVVPLLVYAIMGTSRQLAVGPVAMASLLTAAGVGALATQQTDTYLALAILLSLVAGLLQVGMGLLRLGFLVQFLSKPVISGFTSAAALIIGLSQLKHLLGVPLGRSNFVHEVLYEAITRWGEVHMPTLLLGLGGVGVLLALKRLPRVARFLPGPLAVVLFGVGAVWSLGLDQLGVDIVGVVPQGLPAWELPSWDGATVMALMPMALTIALVSFMESIAIAKTLQSKHRDHEVDANQELLALGMAKVVGAFFQSYANTGGFSRTAVNDQAGAKTPMAGVISALLVGLSLLFFTATFYYLPNAVLASIIMVAVAKLIDLRGAKYLWYARREDFFMMLATFAATLGLGIQHGILLGVLLSLVMVIYRSAYPHVAVLGRIPGTIHFRNLHRFPEAELRDDVLVVRFDAQLYFANADFFRDRVRLLAEEKEKTLRLLVLNFESINTVDSTAMQTLTELVEDLNAQGIRVVFTAVIGPVRDAIYRAGAMPKLGEANFFLHVHDAIEAHDHHDFEPILNGKGRRCAIQTNVNDQPPVSHGQNP